MRGDGWPAPGKAFAVKFHCPFGHAPRALGSSVGGQGGESGEGRLLETGAPRTVAGNPRRGVERRRRGVRRRRQTQEDFGDLVSIGQAGSEEQNGSFSSLPASPPYDGYSRACGRVSVTDRQTEKGRGTEIRKGPARGSHKRQTPNPSEIHFSYLCWFTNKKIARIVFLTVIF